MLIRKAIPSIVRCSNCRVALLNAFASYSCLSVRPTTRATHTRIKASDITIKQYFSTSLVWKSDLVQQQRKEQLLPGEETSPEAENNTESHEILEPTASATPWYLQVENPQRSSNPLLERQQIPDLPSDPPPLLKPMLEHISIDLGLDDLTIFDLRKIDPPPALGANLIMVLGTARSEKHLHVSADRFCRWLKTTYKLTPYADGLMGRGELKLKMRRKARRARLLSSVGSSEITTNDDGLRTGWICVNVGTVEDGRASVEDLTRHHGYVGFGSEAEGAKVVIQMLTEEKREELDLEDLWGKMLRRHERKEDRISKAQDGVSVGQDVGQSSMSEELSDSDLSSAATSN
ncbi:MAG: ATPase synthesis protein 25 mitochondrial [Alectoria fallacina]|uniref:ATPase synthesis protein 25 n=1 Tax=Alectoria fallacina TaxID=1903189 RepID=A0A8H3ESG8_9LECA|nr:MAG: ATPase synthesis protein 25 mitochondrial [Alectoria fallacina]